MVKLIIKKKKEVCREQEKNYWFIEPLDSRTNKIIVGYLEQVGSTDMLEIYVRDEIEPIKAFYIQYHQIVYLRGCIEDYNLKFRVIFSHNMDGPFWVSDLWKIKKPRLEKRKVEEGLKNIKKKKDSK